LPAVERDALSGGELGEVLDGGTECRSPVGSPVRVASASAVAVIQSVIAVARLVQRRSAVAGRGPRVKLSAVRVIDAPQATERRASPISGHGTRRRSGRCSMTATSAGGSSSRW
jgi:hypothetical protein